MRYAQPHTWTTPSRHLLGSDPRPICQRRRFSYARTGCYTCRAFSFYPTPQISTHNALDFAFDPTAAAPQQWLAFLKQLWPDDATSIATLQEIFGLVLTGDTSFQKAFLITGPKRSGKGTIGRVLTRMIGGNSTVAPTLAGLGTNFGLAPLICARLAIISDARLGGRADQQAIAERLQSITGEDAITIDRKFLPA